MSPAPTTRRRRQISTASGLLAGAVAYFLTLLQYSRDLTRTALAPGYFSHFFDLQARAILDGRLSVPEGSLGIEGFVHDGQTYTYFPPWPAILRLPVLMTTHEYDYRLTLLSMALAWIVFAIMLAKLIWLVLPQVTGVEETTGTQAVLAAVFLAGLSGGSFLTYDASLPWVYHEVYVWAVTAAVGGLYWMLRVLWDRDSHSTWWLFVFALMAVGSRATEGWAICLVTIAIALALGLRKAGRRDPVWWRVLLAGAVPLAVSILINEIKFDEVYLFPLHEQVWTQISEQRRAALAANGGTLTGPQFFTTSFMAYLRPDGIRFVDYFPWITLPAHAAPAFHGAVVDQTYRTGSATAFMPTFMLLEVLAVVGCFRPGARAELRTLRWPLLTGILVTGGVMGYGYYAMRYTSEFVPALAIGGAVGTALVARFLAARRRWRPPLVGLLAAGSLFSMLAMMATGLSASALNHRGDQLERYVRLQHELSPSAIARRTFAVDGLPAGGSTDDLAIRGDCEALYINTGDQYEPWLPVQERDQALELDYDVADLTPGQATLLTVTTTRQDRIDVQVSSQRQVRFVLHSGDQSFELAWIDPPTTGTLGLGIRNKIDFSSYEFEATPGGVVGYLPSVYFDDQEDSLPAELTITEDQPALERLGLRMTPREGFPLTLCESLAREAGLAVGSG